MNPLLTKLRNRILQPSIRTLRDWTFGDSRGATAVEYALMLMFVAVVIFLAVTTVGQTVSNMFSSATQGFK